MGFKIIGFKIDIFELDLLLSKTTNNSLID